jgi:ribonuclease HI
MAKTKQKYYVVWKGITPGIYKDWESCKNQVHGVEGAIYKSYTSLSEAESAFNDQPQNRLDNKNKSKSDPSTQSITKATNQIINHNSICVDAACSGNPGVMEYRGVITSSGKEIFHQGPFELGTNNIGEFLAIVHAAAHLAKIGDDKTIIYTDSKTAIGWVKAKKPNTKLTINTKTKALHEIIDKATTWLHNNNILNPIIKWETEEWGEIPADFGRK